MLIIVCGLPGSGKSTFAKALAKKFSPELMHLNSDSIRRELIKNPTYSDDEKKYVYDKMAEYAMKLLGFRRNVIIDATFYRKEERKRFIELAKYTKTYVILCTLKEEEVEKRLKHRKNSTSDADFNVYLRLKAEFEPLDGEYLVIDTGVPIKKQLEIALGYMGAKNE